MAWSWEWMGERLRLVRTRSRYYVPILRWLPRYDWRQDLVHDGVAGLTVAMLLIPQSLSYASGLARLEPVFGLYACLTPIWIYVLLGTSRYVSFVCVCVCVCVYRCVGVGVIFS